MCSSQIVVRRSVSLTVGLWGLTNSVARRHAVPTCQDSTARLEVGTYWYGTPCSTPQARVRFDEFIPRAGQISADILQR